MELGSFILPPPPTEENEGRRQAYAHPTSPTSLHSLRSVHSAFLPLCVCPLCGTTSMGKKERGRGEVDVATAVADDDDGRAIWKEGKSLSALPFG